MMGYALQTGELTAEQIVDELEERHPEGDFDPDTDRETQELIHTYLDRLEINSEDETIFYKAVVNAIHQTNYDGMREAI